MKNDLKLFHLAKQFLDSNELPWMLPLPPWASPRLHALRRLRHIARARLRTQSVARQGWFRTFTQALAWPALSILKAFIAIKAHPGPRHAKLRQLWAYCWLQWAHNIRISDQQDHQLTRPHRQQQASGYIVCRESQALIDLTLARSSGYPAIDEKRAFARFCSDCTLPCPPLLAQGEGEDIQIHDDWPESDLMLKPANLLQGKGIEVLLHQAASRNWMSSKGMQITPATISSYTQHQFGSRPWVLQPRLKNATAWSRFTTGALATTRVITGRLSADSSPCCLGAYLRLPRRGALVDNLCSGGVGAHVDLRTGQLSKGYTYEGFHTEYDHHPDTGALIDGAILPGFQEILSLALHAHNLAGAWTSIGWDITLTESGPQLIEANLHWAIIPGIPIVDTPYIEIMQNALNLV